MKKTVGMFLGLVAAATLQMPVASAQISLANGLQTVAGTGMAGYSGDGSAASSSNLNLPSGVAVDAGRNVFIADTGNHVIRRIDAVTGVISTFAGIGHTGISADGTAATSASLNSPGGIAVDGNGDVFIADTGNNRVVVVFKGGPTAAALITAENSAVTAPVPGAVYTIAGTAAAGFSGDGATAFNSQLNAPAHVAVDSQGAVYIADSGNQRIRAVYTGGAAAKSYIVAANSGVTAPVVGSIYTIVGNGTATSTGDGALAGAATLNAPASVLLDLQNNLYIAEKGGNHVRAIYLSSTSLAGLIALESPGTTATANYIYTLAGTGASGAAGDGALASAATLNQPTGLAVDSASNVYIADSTNGVVREIAAATGYIATYAGSLALGRGYSGDGGVATQGQFQTPADVALDPAYGTLYVADSSGGQRLREVWNASLFPTTSVGSTSSAQAVLLRFGAKTVLQSISAPLTGITNEFAVAGGTACPADGKTAIPAGTVCALSIQFSPVYPGLRVEGLSVADTSGNLYTFPLSGFATGIQTSITPGQISTFAGNGKATFSGDGGSPTSASLWVPSDVVVDTQGNVFINDSGNYRIRVVYEGGATVARLISIENPSVVTPVVGAIYTIAGTGSISSSSTVDGVLGTSSAVSDLFDGFAVDAGDNVYFSDTGAARVRMLSSFDGKLYPILPGSQGVIAVDNRGSLYVGGGDLLKVTLATGVVSNLAGYTSTTSLDGVPAQNAKFTHITGIYADVYGNFYVGDAANGKVTIIYGGGNNNPAAATILATHTNLSAPIQGYIYTIAGNSSGSTGTNILATTAKLGYFYQIAVDSAGNIYLSDKTNSRIRKIEGNSGIIRTIAGGTVAGFTGDGGAATLAKVYSPYSVGLDGAGNLYIGDAQNQRVRVVTSAGFPLTFSTTTVGSVSAAQSVLLNNTGNTVFTPSAITTTAGFTTTSSTVCAAGTALAVGASCSTAVAFSPQVNATTNGTLTFTGAPSNSSLALTGTGTGGVTTTTTLTSPGSVVYGQLVPVQSTVTAGGSPVTAGTVTFSAGSTVLGSAQVNSSGIASTSVSSPGAGTYQLTATFQQTGVNMSSSVAQGLVVTPAPLTVTANNQSMTYGSQFPAFTYGVSGFVNGDTATKALTGAPSLTTTATSQSDAGTYPITITQGTLNAANYSFSFVNGSLTVSGNVSQTITFANVPNTTYGVAPFTLSPSSSSGLPISLSVVSGPATVSGSTVTITGSGVVILQAAQPGNKDYAAAPAVQRSFTVAQAALSIVVKNFSRLYAAPDPAFTGTVTGLVNGDTIGSTLTVTYQGSDTSSSPVGTYPIQAQLSGPSAGNYSVTITPGVLTVTQAALTLTLANASRLYGAQNPAFPASLTGLVNGDSLATDITEQLVTTATVTSPVGTYPITGSVSGSAASNYSLTVVPATLTVTPAPLTATANSTSRMYGQPNPAFTGTFSGAVNGDAFTESFTTTATQATNAGNYSIVPSLSGPALGNYTVSATNGILSIYLANSSTTLAVSGTTVIYGSPVVLTATAASSTTGTPTGAVSFYDGTTLLGSATLNSGVATYTANGLLLGPHTLSAVYAGDYDFYGSSTAQIPVSIVAASYTITPAVATLTLAGQQTATDTLAVVGTSGYSGTITFSCANLPIGLQCAFSPAAATLSATAASQNVTLTVSRTTQALLNGRERGGSIALAQVGGAGLLLLLCLRRRSRKKLPYGLLMGMCAFLLAAACGLTGCASSNPNTGSSIAAGTYSILIQANASTGSSSTVPVNITVQ